MFKLKFDWRRTAQTVFALSAFLLLVSTTRAADGAGTIERDSWSFDRSSLLWNDDADLAKEKAAHRISASGWIEFDFKIDKPGWHELWFAGLANDWARDVALDGRTIFRQSIASAGELNGSFAKEGNLFLSAGDHKLRITRTAPPGQLPSRWKLVPANGRVEAGVCISSIAHPIIKPDQAFAIELTGGLPDRAFKLELAVRSLLDDSLTPVGSVDFPASNEPVAKAIKIEKLKKGAYVLTANCDGKALSVNDLKLRPLIVSAAETQDTGLAAPRGPVTKLDVSGVFNSGMVVQRDAPLPVWGTAPAGIEVKVELAGQSKSVTSSNDCDWKVVFEPLKPRGPYQLRVTSGAQVIQYDDILAGDVWLLSGQSNMGGTLKSAPGGRDAAKDANHTDVRLGWAAANPIKGTAFTRFACRWQPAVVGAGQTYDQLLTFNAIAWGFGVDLNKTTGVPVGMVINNRGGTFMSTWVGVDTMRKDANFTISMRRWDDQANNNGLEQAVASAIPGLIRAAQKKATTNPSAGPINVDEMVAARFDGPFRNVPGKNFEILTRPLAPFPFKGVIWYQGESDSNISYLYDKMLRTFISEWRNLLGEKMHFVIVQIAPGVGKPWVGPPTDSRFGELQQAQAGVANVPGTSIVTTYDLTTPGDDVHYLNKIPVGQRSAIAVLHDVYGQKDVIPTGPRYQSMSVQGKAIRIRFTEIGTGLKIKGETLGGFSIAGDDQKFVWADAKIDGDSVMVSSEKVANPVAVRYGWANQPCGANLYNSADLPAQIFRTDDWPWSTRASTEKLYAR